MLSHKRLPSHPLVVLNVAHSSAMFQNVSDILEGCITPKTADSLSRVGDNFGSSVTKSDSGIDAVLSLNKQNRYDNFHTFYSISSFRKGLRGNSLRLSKKSNDVPL